MSTQRILLIDDDKSISLVIQVSLDELAAWTVPMADSSSEGLRQAQLEKPDAILLAIFWHARQALRRFNPCRSHY